jgi:hypothetical protein
MALHTETDIYKCAYKLTLITFDVIKTIPKEYRFLISEPLRDLCFRMLSKIAQINKVNVNHDRIPMLNGLISDIDQYKVVLRIMNDVTKFSREKFSDIQEMIDSLSKQCYGWRNYCEEKS